MGTVSLFGEGGVIIFSLSSTSFGHTYANFGHTYVNFRSQKLGIAELFTNGFAEFTWQEPAASQSSTAEVAFVALVK